MIKSDIVKIKFTTDNIEIEKELNTLGIDPLRWAIVDVKDSELFISVSYEA
ncbi:hypothetical protein IKU74_02065 [bacterium]|nr:hypothetical protein [bacterium]